jgi:hypothetical protein
VFTPAPTRLFVGQVLGGGKPLKVKPLLRYFRR